MTGNALLMSSPEAQLLLAFADLDILLRPAQVGAATALLEKWGYASDFPLSRNARNALLRSGAHYHLLYRGEPAGIVEIHWRTDRYYPVERDDDAWWQSRPR